MRFSKHVLPAVLACCLLGNLQGADSCRCEGNSRSRKIYVDSKLIKVVPQGIVVASGNHAFLVKAVRFDQNGLFFLKKDNQIVVENSRGRWKCDLCPLVFNTREELLWHILESHT